jgi:hypothetical protein
MKFRKKPVMQEPVAMPAMAKRRVFDAIRGAYDLGYNDARGARAVHGDSAPGYKGRDVEADHGGALISALERYTAPPASPLQEPVAFEKWWEDQGQFCRAGGGEYEKTFAFRAWEAALATPPAAQPAAVQEPVGMRWRWPGYAWVYTEEIRSDLAGNPEKELLYTPPPAAPVQDEWELRGELAKLKCWHRLTEDEADELLRFAAVRPASALHSKEALAWMVDYNGQPTGNIFDNEEKAAAAMQRLNRQYPQDRRSVIPLVRQQDAFTCARPHPPSDHPSAAGASPAGAQ